MNNIRTLDDIPTRHNVMVLTQIALIKTLLCFTCTTTKICSTKDCFHDFFHLNVKTPTVYTPFPPVASLRLPDVKCLARMVGLQQNIPHGSFRKNMIRSYKIQIRIN